jgi:predicted dehydrogenase
MMQRLGATLFLNHPALVNALRRLLPPVDAAFNYRGWPVSVISEDTSKGARLRALQTGPYGRCVYHCDNDVVDHQVVSMEFASGASGALIMHGHSHEYARTMRYEGTRATLLGKFAYGVDSSIEVHDHLNGHAELIAPQTGGGVHGDGDEAIMASFVHSVRDSSPPLTTARESLESHLMAFAAEEARVGGRIVNLDELRPYRSIDSS